MEEIQEKAEKILTLSSKDNVLMSPNLELGSTNAVYFALTEGGITASKIYRGWWLKNHPRTINGLSWKLRVYERNYILKCDFECIPAGRKKGWPRKTWKQRIFKIIIYGHLGMMKIKTNILSVSIYSIWL